MATVTLVPLSLGELLDQTFSYFRKHFWLFAGIMLLPEAIIVGLGIILQVYLNGSVPPHGGHTSQATAQMAAYNLRATLLFFASILPHYIIYAMALGATTYALSEVYLGRTTTIRSSYRVVFSKLWRLLKVILAVLLQSFIIFALAAFLLVLAAGSIGLILPKSLFWVNILVGIFAILGMILGAVLAVMYMVRYSVAVPAVILERLSTRQALKRSVALTRGYLWRLLVVAILMTLISFTVAMLCELPFSIATIMVSIKGGHPSLWLTIPNLLLGGIAGVATAPLLMISFAIAYYDLRVRKEGFDLQLMMSNLEGSDLPAANSARQIKDSDYLEDASVLGTVIWTFVTGGVYQPIWFLQRRRALNNLHSSEKIGLWAPLVALVGFLANFCFPIVGSFKWGSWIEAENTLGPLHPLILFISSIVMVVQCFKVRRILLDHLAPQQDGMFSASIRFQYDDLLSRMGTFFLGIFYLQFKINGLLERLKPDEGGQGERSAELLPVAPLSPINP